MKNSQSRRYFLILFFSFFVFNGCKQVQTGGESVSPTPSYGGTITNLTLTSGSSTGTPGQTLDFTFNLACPNDTDYIICNLNVFNSKIVNQYPLIYQAIYSYPCGQLSTITASNISCQIPCQGTACIWLTLICSNTTTGTLLRTGPMPPNITC